MKSTLKACIRINSFTADEPYWYLHILLCDIFDTQITKTYHKISLLEILFKLPKESLKYIPSGAKNKNKLNLFTFYCKENLPKRLKKIPLLIIVVIQTLLCRS